MIKILFFGDALQGGGAEKALCNLVNRLDRERFQITVKTLRHTDPAGLLLPHITYRAINRGKTAVSRWLMHQWLRLCAWTGWIYPLYLKGDYDLEIAYLECGPTKMLSHSRSRARKLAWVHCDLEKKPGISENRKRMGHWYRKYDKVVCVSRQVERSVQNLFGCDLPTAVLPNVVDAQCIREKAGAFSPEKPKPVTFVAVGRLTTQKGFDRLIAACSMLKTAGHDFFLWILGEGEQRPLLEEMIRREALEGFVQLLGYAENPYPYIRQADALVCSSLYEGISTAVTEALMLGRPVISTPCAGMEEQFGGQSCGILTEDNAPGLAAGMETFLKEPANRKLWAKEAARRGEALGGTDGAAQTEDFFHRCLQREL